MNKLKKILKHNREFVEKQTLNELELINQQEKKIVIVSCMDTRLTNLLPRALNLKNGDAKIIKNAGATIIHPFGSTIRSIAIAVYEFGAEEIFVIGHSDCGMNNLDAKSIIEKMHKKGISKDVTSILEKANIDLIKWLQGFTSVKESVIESIKAIKEHPLLPNSLIVHGLIIDPITGKLELIINGHNNHKITFN